MTLVAHRNVETFSSPSHYNVVALRSEHFSLDKSKVGNVQLQCKCTLSALLLWGRGTAVLYPCTTLIARMRKKMILQRNLERRRMEGGEMKDMVREGGGMANRRTAGQQGRKTERRRVQEQHKTLTCISRKGWKLRNGNSHLSPLDPQNLRT